LLSFNGIILNKFYVFCFFHSFLFFWLIASVLYALELKNLFATKILRHKQLKKLKRVIY
jgi:hypothetical protein